MNRKNLLLIMLFCCLLLSACNGAQADWFINNFEQWLFYNEILAGEGEEVNVDQFVNLLVDDAVKTFLPTDEEIAMDAARDTLKSIEKADEHMNSALYTNSIPELEKAQKLRPDDVTYQEAEAAIWAAKGDKEAADKAISGADLTTIDFVSKGGDCRSARLNQLQIRRDMLVSQLDDDVVQKEPSRKDNIFRMIGNTDDEINAINGGQPSLFCVQLGAEN